MTDFNTYPNLPSALVIEPDHLAVTPYKFLSRDFICQRVPSIEEALQLMDQELPELVVLSVTFPMYKLLFLLEALRLASNKRIIPLVFVIDLNQRVVTLPGITWGNALGILHTLSSQAEVSSTLERILR